MSDTMTIELSDLNRRKRSYDPFHYRFNKVMEARELMVFFSKRLCFHSYEFTDEGNRRNFQRFLYWRNQYKIQHANLMALKKIPSRIPS